MPAPNLIPQGGGDFVGSMPWDPNPSTLENEYYLKDHKERMHAPYFGTLEIFSFLWIGIVADRFKPAIHFNQIRFFDVFIKFGF
jgi:hypothetical protein